MSHDNLPSNHAVEDLIDLLDRPLENCIRFFKTSVQVIITCQEISSLATRTRNVPSSPRISAFNFDAFIPLYHHCGGARSVFTPTSH